MELVTGFSCTFFFFFNGVRNILQNLLSPSYFPSPIFSVTNQLPASSHDLFVTEC